MAEVAKKVEEETPELTKAEEDASKMGWSPQDQWKGNPEAWKDAETFIKDGERIHTNLKDKVDVLNRKLDAQARTMREFSKHSQDQLERQKKNHSREVTALKTEQRQAAQIEDMDRYDDLEMKRAELEANAPASSANTVPDIPPEVMAWKDGNPWFDKDMAMQAYAIERHSQLNNEYPGMSLAEVLTETSRDVRGRFPEKFGPTKRGGAAKVEAGGDNSPKKGGKTYSDLPREAKSACDRFVKEGLFKSRDDYLNKYEWE